MATTNLVTKLRADQGVTLDETLIQAHIDAQNTDGWNLVAVDNLVGWYRFFWEKVS